MPNQRELFTINKQDYRVSVGLQNDENKRISFQPAILEELYFSDNFLNFGLNGYIVFNNTGEILERLPFPDGAPFDVSDRIYKFRPNRDIIFVDIVPFASYGDEEYPDEIWRIKFEGIITEVEDINSSGHKAKKVYFLEKEIKLLTEKNIEFSTANFSESEAPKHKSTNFDRSIKTGEAILNLLKEAGPEFTDKIDETNWDLGNEKNKILYTSPTRSSIYEDIDFILERHTSEIENEPAFFRFQKDKTDPTKKKFSLKNITSVLEESKNPENVEDYYLQKIGEDFGFGIILDKGLPANMFGVANAVKDHSEIYDYEYLETDAIEASKKFNTKIQHSYNTSAGQFNVRLKDHYVNNVKDLIKEKYGNLMSKSNEVKFPLYDKYRIDNYNRSNISINRESNSASLAFGRNKLILSSLFLNMGICFKVKGLTPRASGKFFNIRNAQYNDNDFDHRLEGTYMATNVEHHFKFKENTYDNIMTGFKMNVFTEYTPLPEEDEKIISQ